MRTRLAWVVPVLVALVGGWWFPVGTAAAAPTSDGSTWTTATINLHATALGYDPARDQLLVGISKVTPSLGDRLVELDPHTGAIGRSVAVGPSTSIAVADDSSRAYVGSTSSSSVAEVDLATFTLTRRIDLGFRPYAGAWRTSDLAVQPGHPEVIAVARTVCCTFSSLVVFDHGVERSVEAGPYDAAERLAWSADPATLYGTNSLFPDPSEPGFSTFRVDATGVHRTSNPRGLLTPDHLDITFGDGLIHASDGAVIDPVKRLKLGAYETGGHLAVDASQHKAFALLGGSLRRFDLPTRQTDWTVTVPYISPTRLVDAGAGLAAIGESGIVLLMGPDTSASQFVAPTAPPTRLQDWQPTTAALAVERVVAAPDGAHVYGVARSNAPAHGNELVEVDAATGAIGRTLTVGGDPYRLAISDDGSTVMIAQHGVAALTEVDVTTFTVVHTIGLAADEVGWDLSARPGRPHEFAVSVAKACCTSATVGEVVLVADGAIAPDRWSRQNGAVPIAFAGDPARLYAPGGQDTEVMAVADTGITLLEPDYFQVLPFSERLVSDAHVIYSSFGRYFDPAGGSGVRGSIDDAVGVPVPVPEENRLLFFNVGGYREFLLDTGAFVTNGAVDGSNVHDAVRAGTRVAVALDATLVLYGLGPDPRLPPDAPTRVHGVAGDGQVDVSWTPPHANVVAPVIASTVTASPGGATCSTAGAACTVGGLVNGTPYTFTVRAANLNGAGATSIPSRAVTPLGPAAAPGDVSVTAGSRTLAVSWTPPASDGGSSVTSYDAIATPDAGAPGTSNPASGTCTTATTACTISDLRNGVAYRVTVRPTTSFGPGTSSAPTDPTTPTACTGTGPGPYPDVTADHPFCAPIEWMAGHGLATGYWDGNFHGTAPVTRQAFAAFLYRAAGEPAIAMPAQATFVDVPLGSTFSAAIEWLHAGGYANGFADRTFRPTAPVSRQSAAAMLYRLAGSPTSTPPATPTFVDVPTTHPFATEIEWLVSAGIASGYADHTFRATTSVSRQATAAFLWRFDAR